jgi:hypothetical protein
MSELPPKADLTLPERQVRYVPGAVIPALSQKRFRAAA